MRKIIIASLFFFAMQACSNGYREATIDATLIPKLNTEIAKGRLNKEDWVKTPEDIARHLFPHVTQDGEHSQSYSIEKKEQSSSNCIITITEEGVFDDEVNSARHSLYFSNLADEWSISHMTVEMKWRD